MFEKALGTLKEGFHSRGFQKYFQNTSWLFFEKIIRAALSLLVAIALSRYLGPEQFGILNYAISVVALFVSFTMHCVNDIVVRKLVNQPTDQRGIILGTAFRIKLFGILLMWLLIAGLAYASSNDSMTNLMIAIIAASILLQAFNVIEVAFQAVVQSKFIVRARITQIVVTSLATLTLILLQAELIWFAVLHILDGLVLALGLLLSFKKLESFKSLLSWDFNIAKDLFTKGLPLFFAAAVSSLYMRIDQIMLKELLDLESVGIYAAATKLSIAWYFIPIIICSSLFPAIISSRKVSQELYELRLQKLTDFLVWVAIAIALLMTFFANAIIQIIFGAAFYGAGDVLVLHIWAGVFVFMSIASTKKFIVEGIQHYTLISMTLGAIANGVLNYYLINRYGVQGAAMATLLAYSLSGYLCFSLFRKTRSNFWSLSKSLNPIGVLQRLTSSFA